MWLKRTFRLGRYGLVWAVLALGLVWALAAAPARAAAPVAGELIRNVAGGAYNYRGAAITMNSNAVLTRVDEKSGLILAQNNNKTVPPGGTVYFPHMLTNTGNVADAYTLEVLELDGAGFQTSCAIYADVNNDGVPDDSVTPLARADSCTGAAAALSRTLAAVAPGASYSFLVAVTAKADAAQGGRATIKVKATSPARAGVTASDVNDDTVTVSRTAAFEVTKEAEGSAVSPGGEFTYTFTITNRGGEAGETTVTDKIGVDSGGRERVDTTGLEYVRDSGRWSAGTAVLSDGDMGDETDSGAAGTLRYTVTRIDRATVPGAVEGAQEVKFVLRNVPAGGRHTVRFKVKVKSDAQAGGAHVRNRASYTSPGTCTGVGTVKECFTDIVPFTVNAQYSVVLNNVATRPAGLAAGADLPGTDTEMGKPNNDTHDRVEVPDAVAGSRVVFTNYVWNTGNTADTVRISAVAPNTFPSGSRVEFFEDGGLLRLIENTTPSIPPGGVYKFVTAVSLPTELGTTPPPYVLDVVGTSVGAPVGAARSRDAVANRLLAVTSAQIEIAHSLDGTRTGGGTGKLMTGVVTKCTLSSATRLGSCDNAGGSAAVPGKAVFPVFVRSNSPRTFRLYAYDNPDLTSPAANADWGVEFFLPDPTDTAGTCVDGNNLKIGAAFVSSRHDGNAGTATAKRFVHIACAVVSAKGTSAAERDFYFKVVDAMEPTAYRALQDRVEVSGLSAISFGPNGTGQVFRGRTSMEYVHTLKNTGNKDLTCTFPANVTGGRANWTYVLYLDKDNKGDASTYTTAFDGAIPAGVQYTDGTTGSVGVLGIGKSLRLILKVTAPADEAVGAKDERTVTITPACTGAGAVTPGAQSVVDTTTVLEGMLDLKLTQAAYTSCADTPAGAPPLLTSYTDQQLGHGGATGIKPGQCVCYRVTAMNLPSNADAITDVNVTNAIPANTTIFTPATCSGGSADVVPTLGEAGSRGHRETVRCSVASLPSGRSFTMGFCVKIDDIGL